MVLVLYSFILAGTILLIFVELPLLIVWLGRCISKFSFDKAKKKIGIFKAELIKKETQIKIAVFILSILVSIVGVYLTAIWAIMLFQSGHKGLKVTFLASMPLYYIVFTPSIFYILKKYIGLKYALLTIMYFSLAVASIFAAVKYVDLYVEIN